MHLRSLLATPGVAGPFGATLLGRLPITALGLLLILHVEALTGRFSLAGLAAGGYSLGLAVSAPLLGRLIDRRGQVVVLAPCGAIASVAIAAVAVLPSSAPAGLVIALSVPIGLAMPPLGATLRALWMEVADADRRHAAFALDSAATEALFIFGPVVVAGGIGAWSPRAALVVCAVAVLAGTALYVLQPAVRAWRSHGRDGGLAGPLAAPAVRVLLAVLLLLGASFGAVEVGVAAAAKAAGHRGWAGALMGVWGVGSMVGAVVIARRPAPRDPARALVTRLAALAALHALLVATTDPLLLAPLLLVAGVTVAPAINGVLVLLGEAAPRGTVTEAFTWATCGITGGIAAGSALAGTLAEQSPHGPFLVVIAVGVAAAALGRLRRPALAAVHAS